LIEARILSKRATTISDLLDRAALVFYWSDAGHIGFNDPVFALRSLDADCFESRALLLTAAVFEAAGMGGADA
jgi:hypothetical protein